MIPLLGIFVVFFSVLGGFLLENGKVLPLVQPAEVVMIVGSAAGTLLTANSLRLLRRVAQGVAQVFRRSPRSKAFYLSTLVMLYALFDFSRRHGPAALEDELDRPEQSALFRRHAGAVSGAGVLDFICDTLRLTTSVKIDPYQLDNMLQQDCEIREAVSRAPVDAVAALADALPGLGILAAVLGVVITMNSVTDLPKVIGQKVAAALIGTFLGIFVSYGLVSPLAAHMEHIRNAEIQYFRILRSSIAAYARGMPVAIVLEFARRSIPPDLRPGFLELEKACHRAQGKVVEMPP